MNASSTFNGFPIVMAPEHLKPYLVDGINGAVATGGAMNSAGRQTHAAWDLFRDGIFEKSVCIDLEPAGEPLDMRHIEGLPFSTYLFVLAVIALAILTVAESIFR